ncbi:unnamed protein product [Camellia sinensis]
MESDSVDKYALVESIGRKGLLGGDAQNNKSSMPSKSQPSTFKPSTTKYYIDKCIINNFNVPHVPHGSHDLNNLLSSKPSKPQTSTSNSSTSSKPSKPQASTSKSSTSSKPSKPQPSTFKSSTASFLFLLNILYEFVHNKQLQYAPRISRSKQSFGIFSASPHSFTIKLE